MAVATELLFRDDAHLTKIENKGRHNRRINLAFAG